VIVLKFALLVGVWLFSACLVLFFSMIGLFILGLIGRSFVALVSADPFVQIAGAGVVVGAVLCWTIVGLVASGAVMARNRLRTPPATRQLANRGGDLSLDHR
jgi:hypothetical protein